MPTDFRCSCIVNFPFLRLWWAMGGVRKGLRGESAGHPQPQRQRQRLAPVSLPRPRVAADVRVSEGGGGVPADRARP